MGFGYFFIIFFLTCGILGTVQKAICPLLPADTDISDAAAHVALRAVCSLQGRE